MTRVAKWVFMGSDGIALPALRFLRARPELELAAVFTQPDRPAGRGKQARPNAIKQWAEAEGVPVRQPERLDEAALEDLRAAGPRLVLVMAYGHILRRAWLDCPPLGTFNLHASLLPAYRGASPIQASVASGDGRGGVTLMRMVRKMDAGPVVDAEAVAIGRRDTGADVEEKLAAACLPLLERNLPALLSRQVQTTPQDESRVSYTRKLVKGDGALDFSRPAEEVARRVNGLFPWPSCSFEYNGLPIRAGLADWSGGETGKSPGTVVDADDSLAVASGQGVVHFLKLQRPGGKMLAAADFLRGCSIPTGTVLASRTMPPLVSEKPFPAGS